MTFLLMMTNCLILIIAMSEFIVMSNKNFIKLDEFYDEFAKEAYLISEIKCHLASNGNLDEFVFDGLDISRDNDNYYLNYDGINIFLETEDNMIINYSIR